MISFFEYIFYHIGYLLSLWNDDRVTNAIGANFLYIILSIWLFWIMVNMFLIHPNAGGGLFGVIKGKNIKSDTSYSTSTSSDNTEGKSND